MVDRNDVLAAAQRVLNADPAASTSAVAEAAGISRATLHRHFDTREALLVELGTRSLDQWEQRLDDVDVEGLAAAGDADRLRAALEIYGLLVAAREAVRIGDVARRDAGRLVLSSLLTGIDVR